MSGGSFNYLYAKQGDELFTCANEVRGVAAKLREYGCEDAASRTEHVLVLFVAAAEIAAELEEVWHDVEWACSGDMMPDGAREAVARWRTASVVTVTPDACASALVGVKTQGASIAGTFVAGITPATAEEIRASLVKQIGNAEAAGMADGLSRGAKIAEDAVEALRGLLCATPSDGWAPDNSGRYQDARDTAIAAVAAYDLVTMRAKRAR